MLLDCSDGELARWRGRSSASGVFLDKLGHYTAEALIPVALGVRADGGLGSIGGWTTLGALLAGLVLFNKALNDMVHAARASAGLEPDQATSRTSALRARPPCAGCGRRRGSCRSTGCTTRSSSRSWSCWPRSATCSRGRPARDPQVLVVGLLAAAVVTVAGHVAAILTSSKLR